MKTWITCCLLLLAYFTQAQDSTYVRIQLKQGNSVQGILKNQNDKSISLNIAETGEMTIPWENIQSVTRLDNIEPSSIPNPQPNRYFFGPSAIPLKKGDKYYQNAYFLLNSFQAGLSDHFSLGGGVFVPFALFITPKIGYKISDKVHAGGGILFATSLIRGLNFGVGTVYGSFTYGSNENNITLNAGLGAYNENTGLGRDDYNWKFANTPMFTLAGMTRISKKTMLITENWIFSNKTVNYDDNGKFLNSSTAYNAILSAGLRYIGERYAFDLGFLSPSVGSPSAIPYIAYNVKF
ncbi:MAG: hypothetical protein RLZ91_1299, partial [Bacteroidota bacterium]